MQPPLSVSPDTGLLITFSLRQPAVLGAGHVAVQARAHVLPGGLEVAGAPGRPLAPRPELARGVLRACALTRRA